MKDFIIVLVTIHALLSLISIIAVATSTNQRRESSSFFEGYATFAVVTGIVFWLYDHFFQ